VPFITGYAPTSSAPYSIRLDDVTTASVTYVGFASEGSLTSSSCWKIFIIDSRETPITLAIKYANGNSNFTNIFDNRASLTYS